MSYFQSPNVWEMLKAAWSVFWAISISKMMRPLWIILVIMGILGLIKIKLGKKMWALR